jgi:hypothetical protein
MIPPSDDGVVNLTRRVGMVLFFLMLVNFGWFLVDVIVLGGSNALNDGTVVDGRYYIEVNDTPREVSRFVWNYSYVRAVSVCVTHPLGIFGAAALMAYAQSREKRLARTRDAREGA